jgi:hypothetical protein
MLWMTRGSHGKSYENWALPGAASEMEGGGGESLFREGVPGQSLASF